MISELASKVLADAIHAQFQHWATDSYAQHMALGNFYETVPNLLDEVVEAYQGTFGKVKMSQVQTRKGEIADMLQDTLDWMQAMRMDIAQEDDAIANLIDGICSCYQKTLYKLKHLS